jgi:iron complex transport system substrate-binding protein
MPVRSVPLEVPPRRVVSLVPSLTESFFDLGFGDCVIGITDYCIHPADQLGGVMRVGGPKNPKIEQILKLNPDLVVANQEENSQATIVELNQHLIPVWLTFPVSVVEAFGDLWNLARLFRNVQAMNQIRGLEKSLEYLQMAALDLPKKRTFCPIWQEKTEEGAAWWMTFNRETYSSDLITILGGENVFGDRKRRYPITADLGLAPEAKPGNRDTRYPRVRLEEVIQMNPELILLPDEPYAFGPDDARYLQSAIERTLDHPVKVVLVEGSLITWPGTRIGKAFECLPDLFS